MAPQVNQDVGQWDERERFLAGTMYTLTHKAWASSNGTHYSTMDLYSATCSDPPNAAILSSELTHMADGICLDGCTIVRLYADMLSNVVDLPTAYVRRTALAYCAWKHSCVASLVPYHTPWPLSPLTHALPCHLPLLLAFRCLAAPPTVI